MESGSVLAAETLPKVAKAYREAALAGGAYELALKGLRVTEGQMVKASQEAGDTLFKSGFSQGLSDLYKTIAENLTGSEDQIRKLGRMFGLFFNIIEKGIDLITPPLKFVVDHFGALFSVFMIGKVAAMTKGMIALTASTKTFGTVAAIAWAKALAPIMAVVTGFGLIDDWLGQFDRNKITSDEKSRGYQIVDGKRVGVEQREGKWYDTGKVLDSQGENYWLHSKIAGMMGDTSAGSTTSQQTIQKLEVNITGIPLDITADIEKTVANAFAPNGA